MFQKIKKLIRSLKAAIKFLWRHIKLDRKITLYLPIFILLFTCVEFFYLTTPANRVKIAQQVKDLFIITEVEEKIAPPSLPENKTNGFASVIVTINPLEKWLERALPDFQLLWMIDVSPEKAALYLEKISVKLPDNHPLQNQTNVQFQAYFDTNRNVKLDAEDQLLKTWAMEESNPPQINFHDFEGKKLTLTRDRLPVEGAKAFGHYRFFIVYNQSLPVSFTDFDITLKNPRDGMTLKKNTDPEKPIHNVMYTKFIDENTFKYFDRISEDPTVFFSRHSIFQPGENNQIILPQGDYEITENIIIPKRNMLKIEAGTTLRFHLNISILSYSPV